MKTSRKTIYSILSYASKKYEAFWDILYQLKFGFRDGKPTEDFLDFQYQLGEVLYKLDEAFQMISQKKKEVNCKKSSTNQVWSENRLKVLSHYQDSLKNGIAIGKCLGDSFAWIFYKNEINLIREHLSQNDIPNFPLGIGGYGELAVVKNHHFYNGNFIIYHGITTFLRLGDISLFNLSTQQIIALGEIKTKRINDKNIEVSLILKRSQKKSSEALAKTFNTKTFNISPEAKPRFERQIKRIKHSLEESEQTPLGESSLSGDIHIDELDLLYKKVKSSKFITSKVGDGLLLIAYKSRHKSLPSKLLSNTDFTQKMKRVENDVLKIVDKSKSDTTLYQGCVGYNKQAKTNIPLGFIPIFWWPINPNLIKAIIFQDITIVSLYNPQFFIQKLIKSGFIFNQDNDTGKFEVYKQKSDGDNLQIGNFSIFVRLIMNNLFKEESVINMIENMVDVVEDLDIDPLCEVEFNIIQEF